jgi:serine/threonine protein phosphatase PrpC
MQLNRPDSENRVRQRERELIMVRGWVNWMKRILARKNTVINAVLGSKETFPFAEKPGSMTQVLQPAYTLRLRPETGEAADLYDECPFREQLPVAWHGMTNTGMVRPQNEDSFSCVSFGHWKLYVVADGMGGHDAGEVASRIAVETVCEEIEEGVMQTKDPLRLIEHVVHQANSRVKEEGALRGSNMGTTLSIALVAGNTAYIANVGDSRIYWTENGSITQITQDHSLVAKLVAAGKMTKEEARNHPKSNLLFRTIGTDATIKVDTFQVDLKKGGNLMLCTDGLWGEVSDESIHQAIFSSKDARSASEELVRLANAHGGKDNITAVVVKVG